MKILVYDKIKLLGDALDQILLDIEFVELAEFAQTPDDFKIKLEKLKPDTIIIGEHVLSSLHTPELEFARKKYPNTKFLLMIKETGKVSILENTREGIDGYILLDWSKLELKKALTALKFEGILFPHKIVMKLIEEIRAEDPMSPGGKKLSPMEEKILKLLCKGLQNKEIGRDLGKSDRVVKNYLKTIYIKLGVKSRTEAVSLVYSKMPQMVEESK